MNVQTAPLKSGPIYHDELVQGSQEWLDARSGLITASEVKLLVTPTLKVASNDKERAHLYELAAQRITKYVEPFYVSDDMLRGHVDEMDACLLYAEHYHGLQNIGFITNDKWGFTLGYSPDALVGEDGLLECKSRRQKYQIKTIVENVIDAKGTTIPTDYVMQHQTGLMVAERDWIDFISFSGGLNMVKIRQYPDPVIQEAIINVVGEAEIRIAAIIAKYQDAITNGACPIVTERKIEQEMFQ